jgi:hypothetical protein
MEPDGWRLTYEGPSETHPYHWWKWYTHAGHHIHVDLTLDKLWEVEERLSLIQRDDYWRKLYISIAKQYSVGSLNPWITVHCTATQKIKALAEVLKERK